jgi:SNF2 family DNA or RNA helicase
MNNDVKSQKFTIPSSFLDKAVSKKPIFFTQKKSNVLSNEIILKIPMDKKNIEEPKIEEIEQKDETECDDVVQGKPLENSLENALAVFPLSSKKRCRDQETKTNNNPSKPVLTLNDLKEIITPNEDDLLGDAFNRIQILPDIHIKQRRITDEQKINSISCNEQMLEYNDINSIFNKNLPDIPIPIIDSSIEPKLIFSKNNTLNIKKRWNNSNNNLVVPNNFVLIKEEKEEWMNPNEFGVVMKKPFSLFPYQVETVRLLKAWEEGKIRNEYYFPDKNGGLLAMVMGLGKTMCIVNLVASTLEQQRFNKSTTLYVCPKNLLGTVKHEFHKFLGTSIRTIIYHRDFLRSDYEQFTSDRISQYDVIITNYETICSRSANCSKIKNPQFMENNEKAAMAFIQFPWFRIVCDESHEFRNKRTTKFKAILNLFSSRRIAMTGTPLHNSISDIFSQLEFTGLNIINKKKNKLCKSLLQTMDLLKMIHFVEEKDANIDLPRKSIKEIYFSLSENEMYIYAHFFKIMQKIFVEMQMGNVNLMIHVTNSLLRLLQICTAPYLITPDATKNNKNNDELMEPDPSGDIEQLHEYNVCKWIHDKTGDAGYKSTKILKFVELVQTIREEKLKSNTNMKIVVFANYVSSLQLAIESLVLHYPYFKDKYVFVHGGINSSKTREILYSNFRSLPNIEILFTTIKLSSVGLNLIESDTAIFLERWYSYASLHQAESRIHRIGQVNPVNIYYLIAQNTVEERIMSLINTKKQLHHDVMDCHQEQLKQNDFYFICKN